MVIRQDLQLNHLPPSSCANCGFLLQDKGEHDGSNFRDRQPVSINERATGLDYLNAHVYQGTNAKLASLRCWMRRDFPGNEARPAISGDDEGHRLILAAMHRDRGEASDAFCPQFTPWVPHLSLQEHWRERRNLLLDESQRNFQRTVHEGAQRTQLLLAGLAAITIVVTVLVGWWNADATRRATREQIEYQRANPAPTPVFAPVFNAPPANITVTVVIPAATTPLPTPAGFTAP